MILQRLGVEIEIPLRRERVLREFQAAAARRADGVGEAIETPRLIEVIILVPHAEFERVGAQREQAGRDDAITFDVIFGGADRHRRAAGGGDIGREPEPAALIAMVIAHRLQRPMFVQRRLDADAGEPVLAEAGSVIIGIVDRRDRRPGRRGRPSDKAAAPRHSARAGSGRFWRRRPRDPSFSRNCPSHSRGDGPCRR